MNATAFFGMKDDAISIEGGDAELEKVFVGGKRSPGIALKGVKGARIGATDLHVQEMAKVIEGREGARISVIGMVAESATVVADAQKREMRYGPVTVEITGLKDDAIDASYEVGEGSSITLDGKSVGGTKQKPGT